MQDILNDESYGVKPDEVDSLQLVDIFSCLKVKCLYINAMMSHGEKLGTNST